MGGLTGRYFQHWKSQSLAPVRENCMLFYRLQKISKISQRFAKKTFHHSFRTLCRSTALSTLISSLAFSNCLAVARSTQSLLCFADLCWSCLSFWYGCPVEAYLWFSSTCNRYHLSAHSKMVLVLFASSEQILQQRDSLPHVSTGMSSTRRGMPLHHQWPSKIPLGSSPC